MNIHQLHRKINEAGWTIIRSEQTHYVVENREGEKRVIWISHKGDQPRAVIEQIYKKLGITGEEKSVTRFYRKQQKAMPKFGTYGYEMYMARSAKKMSLPETATAVGLSPGTIVNYESNKSTPSPEIQEKLATVLRWPALQVIKSATQTISDSPEPRLEHSEPVVIESGNAQTREVVEQDTKRGWQARKARREKRQLRGKVVRVPKIQRVARSKVAIPQTRQEIFDGAMLAIRMQFNELVEKANKWDAIKDLIKDED